MVLPSRALMAAAFTEWVSPRSSAWTTMSFVPGRVSQPLHQVLRRESERKSGQQGAEEQYSQDERRSHRRLVNHSPQIMLRTRSPDRDGLVYSPNYNLGGRAPRANAIQRSGRPVAMLPFHHRYGTDWPPDPGEDAPFVLMLPLSAQHIRGLGGVEIPRSYRAAGGRLPQWRRS